MLLYTLWYGTFILERKDDGWEVVEFIGSGKDASEIAEDLSAISKGEILQREMEIAEKFEITRVTEERSTSLKEGLEVIDPIGIEVPGPMDKGYTNELLIEANILKARTSASEGPQDANILSGVGALTDIDTSLNLVQERIREWYSKYWPESGELVDNKEFLEGLKLVDQPTQLREMLISSGSPLGERLSKMPIPEAEIIPDLSGVSQLAGLVLSLWDSRESMEKFIETEMQSLAPRLSTVVGPLIGARLIGSAGGLMRLSLLPSSTVQVLGAEKMFFKFLKEGGKPPKHGLLFQHPWVHSLPSRKRGKMARSIASAASLAARMDAYGGGDPGPLKEKLEKRAAQIKEMEITRSQGSGRQPPFREGWWANKSTGKGRKKRGRRKR